MGGTFVYNSLTPTIYSSWSDPYGDLQQAINDAQSGDDIWVAEGTYKPTQHIPDHLTYGYMYTLDDRYKTFYINKNIRIYGGFVGNEYGYQQRGIIAKSTLSGDIDNNGVLDNGNVYNIVTIHNATGVVLDGFEITGGNANGGYWYYETYINIINPNYKDHWERGCFAGAGIYITRSSVDLYNLDIHHNFSIHGGGIYIDAARYLMNGITYMEMSCGNVYLTDVKISNNEYETIGGGIFANNMNILELINVAITQNTPTDSYSWGGGMYLGEYVKCTLINVTIASNIASVIFNGKNQGGQAIRTDLPIPLVIKNSIIHHDRNSSYETISSYSPPILTQTNSLIKYVNASGSNLGGTTSPGFWDPTNGDYTLDPDWSDCVGAGNNSDNPRRYDLKGDLRRVGTNIDLGAYESGNTTKSFSERNIISYESEILSELSMNVFPNPISNNQQLKLFLGENNFYYEDPVQVRLYSLDGKLLYNKQYSNGDITMDLPQIPSGIYIIKAQTQEGNAFNKKLVVTR